MQNLCGQAALAAKCIWDLGASAGLLRLRSDAVGGTLRTPLAAGAPAQAGQEPPLVEPLSERELRDPRLIGEGCTNQEIAGRLVDHAAHGEEAQQQHLREAGREQQDPGRRPGAAAGPDRVTRAAPGYATRPCYTFE